MTIKRGDELLTKTVTLGGRDDDEYEENMIHVADMFKGGKSKVRSGFANVIAHDARVQARDCGGPVFDTDWQLRWHQHRSLQPNSMLHPSQAST